MLTTQESRCPGIKAYEDKKRGGDSFKDSLFHQNIPEAFLYYVFDPRKGGGKSWKYRMKKFYKAGVSRVLGFVTTPSIRLPKSLLPEPPGYNPCHSWSSYPHHLFTGLNSLVLFYIGSGTALSCLQTKPSFLSLTMPQLFFLAPSSASVELIPQSKTLAVP